MKASVIIPVHNGTIFLGYTLEALCHQDLSLDRFDVLVIDHGSDDDIAEAVHEYDNRLNIRCIRVERNGYGAAFPRNAGIQSSQHDIIIMIDADMIVSPWFIRAHIASHEQLPRGVAVGYIYGLGWSADPVDWTRGPQLKSQEHYRNFFKELAGQGTASDWRNNEWVRVGNDLMRLHAPWGHFWTGNISVHRDAISVVGGFDEHYYRAEDVDLGYRLFEARLPFRLARLAAAFHIPHAVNLVSYTKYQQLDYLRFLTKFPCIEVEAYVTATKQLDPNRIFPAVYALQKTIRLDSYPPQSFHIPSDSPIQKPCLIIGCGNGNILDYIDAEAATEANPISWRTAKDKYKSTIIHNLLGTALPFPDKIFASVLVTDYWRLLPIPVLRDVLNAALRVGQRVLLLACRDWFTTESHHYSVSDNDPAILKVEGLSFREINQTQVVPQWVEVFPSASDLA